MSLHDVKTARHHDRLSKQRRRRQIAGSLFILLVLAAAISGLIYFFFFSSVWKINSVTAEGLAANHKDAVLNFVTEKMPRSSFLFSAGKIRASLLDSFSFIDSAEISKAGRHEIKIKIIERKPKGFWCFSRQPADPTGGCYFFDEAGYVMDQTTPSSGYLLLTVNDKRSYGEIPKELDKNYFEPVLELIKVGASQDLKLKNIEIPTDAFGEFKAWTSAGYPILFSLDSSIQNQLETLAIFLNDKKKDPSFTPQYLDLKIPGRVYYK